MQQLFALTATIGLIASLVAVAHVEATPASGVTSATSRPATCRPSTCS